MFCPNCGKEIVDDSVFCEHCGCRVDDAQMNEPASQQSFSGESARVDSNADEKPVNASTGGSNSNIMQSVIVAILVVAIIAILGGGFYFAEIRKGEPIDNGDEEISSEIDEQENEKPKKKKKDDKADAEEKKDDHKKEDDSKKKAEDTEISLTENTDSTKADTEETASQVSTENTDVSDEGFNPDYNPETYAITGGTWDILQSGERMYTLANGTSVSNAWIEEKGKYYYVDFTGCLMMNNYTADGFYVKEDGSWDKSVKQRKDDVQPVSGATYGSDPTLVIDIINYSDDANYAIATRTYSFGYSETFSVMPLGNSTYLLEEKDDYHFGFLMSVSEDGKTLTVSVLGLTEVYESN